MNTRQIQVTAAVVLLHVGLLWALQQGLLQRAVEVFVPAEILASIVPPSLPPPPPAVKHEPPPPPPKQTVQPTPTPVVTHDPTPAPNAPVVVAAPAPVALPPIAPVAPAAPAAPARVDLPSSVADYLNNPPPPYPAISKKLREEGRVVVRVLIGADGLPKEAHVVQSSGYERLDNAAREATLKWRYVPGKRNGVPTTMAFDVPLIFELK